MSPQQLAVEAQSDHLLKGVRGVYTELQLKRQDRLHSKRNSELYRSQVLAQITTEAQAACRATTIEAINMAGLRPLTRQIALLSVDGFGYREISEKCGVSVGSVGNHLARAEESLRHCDYSIWRGIAEIFSIPTWQVELYCTGLIR